jgi:hypothetical protein
MTLVLVTDEPARRGLGAVLALGRVLSSTASYEQAVATMVAMVSDVLDVETCGFFLHDEERQELVLQRPGFDAYDQDVFASSISPCRIVGRHARSSRPNNRHTRMTS